MVTRPQPPIRQLLTSSIQLPALSFHPRTHGLRIAKLIKRQLFAPTELWQQKLVRGGHESTSPPGALASGGYKCWFLGCMRATKTGEARQSAAESVNHKQTLRRGRYDQLE